MQEKEGVVEMALANRIGRREISTVNRYNQRGGNAGMEQTRKKDIIKLRQIVKRFYIGKPNELEILHGIDLTVRQGEFVAVVGESGSGKSTLMNIIGALDRPTDGQYLLSDTDVGSLKDQELSEIRNRRIGFVFQTYNLVSRTTALANVELPMLYAGVSKKERLIRAKELMEMVGMADRIGHLPEELSGGQKQRTAIARAMANDPAILLADEPTGALDSKAAGRLLGLFEQINREGQTILMVTHSTRAASHASRVLFIKDGEVYHQLYRGELTNDEMYQRISDSLTVLSTGGVDVE